MNIKTKTLLVSLVITFSIHNSIYAQEIRLAGLEYANYAPAKLKDGDYETSFQEFAAFAYFPTVLKNKKTILFNGLQYRYVDANFTGDIFRDKTDYGYQSISYSLMAIHKFNEEWAFMGMLSPTLSSDFKDELSGDDFIMQGLASVSKKINPYFTVGGGLMYTTRLGKPRLLPYATARYKKDRNEFSLILPSLNYFYQVDEKEKLKIGLRVAVNGGAFHVSADEYDTNITDLERFQYTRGNIGPVINYKISKYISLEAFGGLSTLRNYRFDAKDGSEYNFDSKNGGFFNIGLSISPNLK